MATHTVSSRPMSLQALYGRPGELPARVGRGSKVTRDRALTPEVVARVDEAIRARPVEDLPSAYAEPIYSVLLAHGFDRRDLLSLAASLVDLVTSDVKSPAANVT